MALTEITRDVKGNTLTFIEAYDDGAGVVQGFHKGSLSAYDLTVLDGINTNGTGADLKEKLAASTLSNGANAFEVYGPNLVNVDDYAAMRLRKYLSANVGVTVADHESTLADHETRITTLEP